MKTLAMAVSVGVGILSMGQVGSTLDTDSKENTL